MPDKLRAILFGFTLALIGTTHAELRMGAQISNRSIPIGEMAFIEVSVAGVAKPSPPTIEVEQGDATGVRASANGSGTQTIISEGRRQQLFTYQFAVTGLKPGEYSLAATIEHGGESFATDPMKLTVRPPTEAEKQLDPSLEIVVEKDEIYLGEMLPINLVISMSPRTRAEFQNASPEVESNGFVMQPFRGPFQARPADGRNLYAFEGNCEALKAGDITLGPASYQIQVAIPTGRFGQSVRKQHNLTSAAHTIKVKPLPTDGKPKSFSGTVGNFKMEIDAAPLKLKQGEPISVSLSIAGEGNLPSIDVPTLDGNTNAWKVYEAKRIDSRDDNRRNSRQRASNAGRVIFTRVIVPLSIESEIPPFEFSYFNPETGNYETLRTDPIPIEVSEDPNAIAVAPPTKPETNDPGAPRVPNKVPPAEDMQDILSIRQPDDAAWQAARTPLAHSKLFWALQAPPAAALLGLIFFAVGRRINDRRADSSWAGTYPPCAEILRKLEAKHQDASQFYRHAHQFLAAWEEQAPAASSDTLDPAVADSIAEIRERHNFLEFGAPDGEGQQPLDPERRRSVIETLKSLPADA